nr:hypothetical protein [uncultured Amphritea sp.]
MTRSKNSSDAATKYVEEIYEKAKAKQNGILCVGRTLIESKTHLLSCVEHQFNHYPKSVQDKLGYIYKDFQTEPNKALRAIESLLESGSDPDHLSQLIFSVMRFSEVIGAHTGINNIFYDQLQKEMSETFQHGHEEGISDSKNKTQRKGASAKNSMLAVTHGIIRKTIRDYATTYPHLLSKHKIQKDVQADIARIAYRLAVDSGRYREDPHYQKNLLDSDGIWSKPDERTFYGTVRNFIKQWQKSESNADC